LAAVIGVTGLAFEARIAAGRNTRAICSGDRRMLAASIACAVTEDCRGLISFGIAGGLSPDLRTGTCDRDSARLMGAALESGDFVIAPDFTTCASHLKFIYDAPGSLRVRDIVMLTEQGVFSSAEIGLRLRA
jgi:hypothetical protein